MKINLPLLNFCLSTFNSNKLIASKTLFTNKMVQLFVFVRLNLKQLLCSLKHPQHSNWTDLLYRVNEYPNVP